MEPIGSIYEVLEAINICAYNFNVECSKCPYFNCRFCDQALGIDIINLIKSGELKLIKAESNEDS